MRPHRRQWQIRPTNNDTLVSGSKVASQAIDGSNAGKHLPHLWLVVNVYCFRKGYNLCPADLAVQILSSPICNFPFRYLIFWSHSLRIFLLLSGRFLGGFGALRVVPPSSLPEESSLDMLSRTREPRPRLLHQKTKTIKLSVAWKSDRKRSSTTNIQKIPGSESEVYKAERSGPRGELGQPHSC
jgi:hypothetical protein